jgi:hypothetical protein
MDNVHPLARELVQEFVGQAHSNLQRVQELLAQEPGLINAAWDWGGGDFETGLGAAAHSGQRAIALYLLDHGARLDLPAMVMLGDLNFVKAAIAAHPAAAQIPGAHDIPLIAHAEAGGPEAVAVLKYLKSLGSLAI